MMKFSFQCGPPFCSVVYNPLDLIELQMFIVRDAFYKFCNIDYKSFVIICFLIVMLKKQVTERYLHLVLLRPGKEHKQTPETSDDCEPVLSITSRYQHLLQITLGIWGQK